MDEREFDVYLRPITVEDTDDIIQWRNSEDVRKYFIYQGVLTREGHLRWLETRIQSGEVVQFIIVEKRTEESIGSVYLRDVDHVDHKAEYGIFIGMENKKGKGYGTQAAKLLIRYAFEILDLHRVYLRVFADNKRAIASYQKAGFCLEGISRSDVYVRGTYKDIAWMAVINSKEEEQDGHGEEV